MPCTVAYSKCTKTACDTNCRSCQYWEPGSGSLRRKCTAPQAVRFLCRQSCSQACAWFVSDLRRVDNPPRDKERREYLRQWRRANRIHRRKYLQEWRRRNREKSCGPRNKHQPSTEPKQRDELLPDSAQSVSERILFRQAPRDRGPTA